MKKTVTIGPLDWCQVSFGFNDEGFDLFLKVDLSYPVGHPTPNRCVHFNSLDSKNDLLKALKILSASEAPERIQAFSMMVGRKLVVAVEGGETLTADVPEERVEEFLKAFQKIDIWDAIKGFQYHELV